MPRGPPYRNNLERAEREPDRRGFLKSSSRSASSDVALERPVLDTRKPSRAIRAAKGVVSSRSRSGASQTSFRVPSESLMKYGPRRHARQKTIIPFAFRQDAFNSPHVSFVVQLDQVLVPDRHVEIPFGVRLLRVRAFSVSRETDRTSAGRDRHTVGPAEDCVRSADIRIIRPIGRNLRWTYCVPISAGTCPIGFARAGKGSNPKEPYAERNFHVAIWHKDLIELHDKGYVWGVRRRPDGTRMV